MVNLLITGAECYYEKVLLVAAAAAIAAAECDCML